MKKQILILLVVVAALVTHGQVIENRLTLQLGALHGTFSGDSIANENGFVMSALFPQLKGTTGVAAAATYKLLPVLSLGLGAELQYGYGWTMQSAGDFDGAKVLASSVFPFVQVHTPVVSTGLFNKLELMGGIGFFTGKLHFQMEFYNFEIQGNRKPESRSVSEQNNWQGLRVDYGLRYAVNEKMGFYLQAWNRFGQVDASFYSDKQVNSSGFELGVVYSILKVKRIGY